MFRVDRPLGEECALSLVVEGSEGEIEFVGCLRGKGWVENRILLEVIRTKYQVTLG